MCNKHVFNMNNSVNSVHEQLPQTFKVTTRHDADIGQQIYVLLKKKIGEPVVTNISTIITH